ncbi:MAG: hypothetical protein AB1489_26955 [Acidobacteriota bacterium]
MKKIIILPISLFVCLVFALTIKVSVNSNSNKVVPLPVNPREDATVTMTFDGLMALCMGNPERVSVGLLDVHHHIPLLTISKVVNGKKSIVTTLKGEQLRGTTYIDVAGNRSMVTKYLSAAMQNDSNDFRWNIDMEADLHQRELHLKEERLFGKIHISAGLFYAVDLSEERVRFLATDGSGKMLSFDRRVATPAAKWNLSADQALVIDNGKDKVRLVGGEGVQYQIALTNEPPAEMASMDHFTYYYDFIEAQVTRYNITVIKRAAFAPKPHLCMSTVFSRSKLN